MLKNKKLVDAIEKALDAAYNREDLADLEDLYYDLQTGDLLVVDPSVCHRVRVNNKEAVIILPVEGIWLELEDSSLTPLNEYCIATLSSNIEYDGLLSQHDFEFIEPVFGTDNSGTDFLLLEEESE